MNSERTADEDAIRNLVDRQVDAWAAADPEAYAGVFTSDADYITFLGSHHKGRKAIAASYVPLFKKFLKGSELEIEILQVRFATPDVALVVSNAVVKRNRRWARRRTRVNTSVAVRIEGQWLFASAQNTTHRRFAETLLRALTS
ncbi:SgcJ/EcaC family oxidoreductase [Mycobacterium sp. Aquia_216]|uniref:SgcJ/EcaC family oxidoreductase n=1 Tax=Mycobacterium sp. Aquia_216 TaxID=2991729 RepID=UPI00227D6C46|nr:SgcJ/EcaC family oxidoreductase [Mycobacterium sp. Aquia_216]WAJ43070.1 SgcJ/EcaC family oxidoreductase [Mycobacterium sp. Aquia_216]